MPQIRESKLDEEFDPDKKKNTQNKYKTTDTIKCNFRFGLKQIDDKLNAINAENISKQDSVTVAKALKEDLYNLTWTMNKSFLKNYKSKEEASDLLMTLMSRPDQAERIKDIQNRIRIIDEKNRKFREEIKLARKKESERHPQGDFVERHNLTSVSKFNNKKNFDFFESTYLL